MFFRFPKFCILPSLFALSLAAGSPVLAQQRILCVCADPNNLPYSNAKQQGFENRLAELIASGLHARLVYHWQRMDQGFVRETLNKSLCDVVMGVPSQYAQLLTTSPYYRSVYVFIYKKGARPTPSSLDDPALHAMKVGIQAVGEQYTPPGDALARRGLQSEIVPFQTRGGDENEIFEAVADGKLNAAIVWGPAAGYFSQLRRNEFQLIPINPEIDRSRIPLAFAISMGVRKGNHSLRDQLEGVLARNRPGIHAILARYGIPQLPLREPSREAE